MSPSNPPTANATMILRLEGSTLVGTRARRKFGGPEMYAVAVKALRAGEVKGKRVLKARARGDASAGTLWSFPAARDSTILHFWTQ